MIRKNDAIRKRDTPKMPLFFYLFLMLRSNSEERFPAQVVVGSWGSRLQDDAAGNANEFKAA
jgi:hypothetical protein